MPLHRLDHVNILTANLAQMIDWCERILGMTNGDRPPFSMGGAWMYLDGNPVVHLVETPAQPQTVDPRIEHFAISGTGMKEFLDRLKDNTIAYRIGIVPDRPLVQVNIHDPDGNHIHLDFHSDEAEGLI